MCPASSASQACPVWRTTEKEMTTDSRRWAVPASGAGVAPASVSERCRFSNPSTAPIARIDRARQAIAARKGAAACATEPPGVLAAKWEQHHQVHELGTGVRIAGELAGVP